MGKPNGSKLQDEIVTVPATAGSIIIFPGTTPHRSLNSVSPNIRWSCDFRIHPATARRPGKSKLDWFYGLKDSLLLREAGKDIEPEWEGWANVDRTEVQDAGKGLDAEKQKEDFDPVIVGPWMDLVCQFILCSSNYVITLYVHDVHAVGHRDRRAGAAQSAC